MAKHHERVIVDVRSVFPSAASASCHTTQPENDGANSGTDASSLIHETPSTTELNTNSNFILGSHEDLGVCLRNTDINQSRRQDDTAVTDASNGEHDLDTFDAHSDTNGAISSVSSFDVTAFMNSYMNNESNKRNPLFNVENDRTSNSASVPSQNWILQNDSEDSNSCFSSHENTNFTVKTNHSDVSSRNAMEISDQIHPKTNTVEICDQNHTGEPIIQKNEYNETRHLCEPNSLMEEEEVSMEFWEEEAQDHVPKLYSEYVGEDFSQYLHDEKEIDNPRKDGNISHGTNLLEMEATGPVNPVSPKTPKKKKSPGLKAKFSRIFHLNAPNGKSKPTEGCQSNIHNFAYSNSKIGTACEPRNKDIPAHYFNNVHTDDTNRLANGNSGISCRNYNSNLIATGHTTRTSSGNSDVILRSRQPSASSSGGSMNSNSLLSDEDNRLEEFSRDDNHIEPDFESKRKKNLYDSKGKKPTKKPHNNLFKINLKMRKRNSPNVDSEVMDVVQNTVFNPLSESCDVYL